jgi:D-alanine-D-alanine ligase-like ATP-grasp enzyme
MRSSHSFHQKKFINSGSRLVINAARKRGIKAKPILPSLFYYELSRGKKKYLFCEGMCDLVSAPASIAASRKDLSYKIMKKLRFPVPESILTGSFSECVKFLKKHQDIVIKPKGLKWGLGITAGVRNKKLLKGAIDHVSHYISEGDEFIAQEFLDGDDYRVLVIGYKEVFCLQRNPACVIGDGKTTIKELIKKRKIKAGSIKKFLQVPPGVTSIALQVQGFTMNSIVPCGKIVKLNTAANAHFGGFTVDATNVICKEAKKIAIDVAKHFATPVLGVDCISQDISKTIGKITELNTTPDLFMHTKPTFGKGHNPAKPLIDFLFFSKNQKDLKLRPKLIKPKRR